MRCLAPQIFEASRHVPCKRFPGFLPPLCLCSPSVASVSTPRLLLVTFILPVSLLESVLPRGTLASAVGGRVPRAQPAASLVLASDCRLGKQRLHLPCWQLCCLLTHIQLQLLSPRGSLSHKLLISQGSSCDIFHLSAVLELQPHCISSCQCGAELQQIEVI